MLKLSTYKGENAFIETDEETYKRFIGNVEFINKAPARTLLEFIKYSPGKYFSKITNPIYVAVCTNDSLAPAEKLSNLQIIVNTLYVKNMIVDISEIYLDHILKKLSMIILIFIINYLSNIRIDNKFILE